MTTTAPAHGQDAGIAGFRHERHEVDGTTLHAVVGGDGPAVVLVHGWPFTWRAWRPLLGPLAAAGYTVIAPDLPGTGDSAPPPAGYGKDEIAGQLDGLVRTLGLPRAHVVGMDIGTMVAFAWATRADAVVDRLVLTESVLPGLGLEELMNPATGGYWHFGFHMQVDLAAFLTEGKERAYLEPSLAVMARGLSDADREDVLAHYAAPGGMRGGFAHYGTLLADGEANRKLRPGAVTGPVLVLNGERGLPQQPLLDGVRRVATDVRHDIVPGAGHTFGADNPAWTARRLHRFFSEADHDAD